ncbi:MAG TPA: glycosyltransferase 87 family protein, partial [Acidobacteriaceae bacterium]
MIAVGALFVGAVEYLSTSSEQTTERDFIQYWVIGQQLAHGANPYDAPAIVALEHSVGLAGPEPRISLSPPVVLWPMLPLGLFGPRVGFAAWSLLLLGCLSVINWLLWRLNGRPDSLLHLVGYAFAPAIVCVMSGQLSIFLLLGIVLFLTWHESRPLLAGAA